jgi:hypothetical protein
VRGHLVSGLRRHDPYTFFPFFFLNMKTNRSRAVFGRPCGLMDARRRAAVQV